ncbi:SRPBCC family protein [Rufibacter tibetensis]|uniref:Uncharacterized protein n=1 Tax=Rufibacter tibetensis TaxID=512763 RepID=A0A0P0CCW6_9BACT|nr:hypothetical protein [Rufibacter tibetensis]ALJ01538.1 hypothetical protein DC20_17285 [Rufibacter tibetensis]
MNFQDQRSTYCNQGVRQKLSSHITAFERLCFFADKMLTAAFKSFRHEHRFEAIAGEATRMTDVFHYTSSLGLLGNLADYLFLKQYRTHLLLERNRVIKEVAESGRSCSLLKSGWCCKVPFSLSFS